MRSCSSWKTNSPQFRTRVTRHQHRGDETAQHHPPAGGSQSVDGRQQAQCWIGHEPAKLFQILMMNAAEKEFIQRSESGDRADQDSLDSVCRETRFTRCSISTWIVHTLRRPLRLPQVQYIQKVQQSTEVSKQQYTNDDVPAENAMQEYRHTQTLQKTDEAQQVPFPERRDQNIVKDAQTQRQVQMIQKMPSEIHNNYHQKRTIELRT